jgi:hypothetical protein
MNHIDAVDLRVVERVELKDLLIVILQETGTEMSCRDFIEVLAGKGLKAKGHSFKDQVRNVHSTANSHPLITKIRPGRFCLIQD